MPIRKVKGGYKWGSHGKVYPTREGALRQARAAYAHGYEGKSADPIEPQGSLLDLVPPRLVVALARAVHRVELSRGSELAYARRLVRGMLDVDGERYDRRVDLWVREQPVRRAAALMALAYLMLLLRRSGDLPVPSGDDAGFVESLRGLGIRKALSDSDPIRVVSPVPGVSVVASRTDPLSMIRRAMRLYGIPQASPRLTDGDFTRGYSVYEAPDRYVIEAHYIDPLEISDALRFEGIVHTILPDGTIAVMKNLSDLIYDVGESIDEIDDPFRVVEVMSGLIESALAGDRRRAE